jgi:hypothetical protein
MMIKLKKIIGHLTTLDSEEVREKENVVGVSPTLALLTDVTQVKEFVKLFPTPPRKVTYSHRRKS